MIGPCVILTSSNTQTEIQVLSSFVKYVEKRTMLNQNKKTSNLFLGTEFGKIMYFLSNVH